MDDAQFEHLDHYRKDLSQPRCLKLAKIAVARYWVSRNVQAYNDEFYDTTLQSSREPKNANESGEQDPIEEKGRAKEREGGVGEQKEERENKEDVHEEDEEIEQQEGSSQPGVGIQPERDSVTTSTGPGQALGQPALFR